MIRIHETDMKKYFTCLSIAILLLSNSLFSQLSEQDVRQRLDLIHSGKIEQVRTEIPLLLKQLPNDPGVKYLEAYVTENGDHAVYTERAGSGHTRKGRVLHRSHTFLPDERLRIKCS